MKNLRIAFLLDEFNNWIFNYVHKFINEKDDKNIYEIKYSIDFRDFDIVFILGYTKILPKSFLTKNKLNLIIHESALPLGKGFSPIQWQILNKQNEIPVSLIEAKEKVDSGDIFLKTKIIFDGTELFDQIRFKQANASLELIDKFISQYPNYTREKQSGDSTFYKKREKKDGELDPNKTILENFNLLRIGNNEEWPSFFMHKGLKYIIKIYRD